MGLVNSGGWVEIRHEGNREDDGDDSDDDDGDESDDEQRYLKRDATLTMEIDNSFHQQLLIKNICFGLTTINRDLFVLKLRWLQYDDVAHLHLGHF